MNFEHRKPIILLKNEHLEEGVKPIIGGIYDKNNIDKETQSFLNNLKKDADFVNFIYTEKDIKENKMYNSGKLSYVISFCNEKNKYSENYLDCTGVVIVGKDKETGKNISFLSHQNPDFFIKYKEGRLKFKADLDKSIDDLISKCKQGTIDAIIFGGNKQDVSENIPDENFNQGIDNIDEYLKGPFDEYVKSVKYLNYIIKQKIGFSPVVISGPNDNFETNNHSLNIYFDNNNRRLYILKPKQENSDKNEAFEVSNIEEQMKKF